MNNPELVLLLQQGDESAFKQLVDEYQDMVYNTALGIVQHEDDADDITQDVFIQVFRSVNSFKGESKFSTWLYRITLSKALDHEKKKKRKKRFGFVQNLFGTESGTEAGQTEFDHPGVKLENKEKARQLFDALKLLPEKQRIAFTLQKLEGQRSDQVAEIMSTTVYAVEALLSRAKLNLKKELQKIYGDHLSTK